MTPRIGNDGQSGEDALRVLLSTRGPFKTTNPYVVQLADSIRTCGASVRYFSWQTALFGSYDILHIHWPEVMIRRDGALARAAARSGAAERLLLANRSPEKARRLAEELGG
ncbi:MAG: hypothetical protein ABS976_25745, partial [Rhodococcus sp. (in: high G+C Gram-positive bacteria)]